ncbi:apolipoprotein N-acyltransferase [Rubripirellula amarantea]|nr:apolipoprotein N-acyltransferase [Rubripirellula amarantea]
MFRSAIVTTRGWILPTLMTCGVGVMIGLPWLYQACYPIGLLGYAWLIFRAASMAGTSALLHSFLSGSVALAIAFHWASQSISDTTNLGNVLSWVVFGCLVFWEAIPFGLLGWAASCCLRWGPRWIWALVPLWIALTTHWPKVFAWETAHAFLGFPPILQLAELAGTAGVTAAAMIAAVAVVRWGLEPSRLSAKVEASLGGSVVVAACLWGTVTLEHWRERIASAEQLRVGVVQVDPSYVESLNKMQVMSDAMEGKVDLLLWPESTLGHYHVGLDHFRDTDHTMDNAEMPNPAVDPYPRIYCDLLAGGKTYENGGKHCGPYKNTAFLMDCHYQIVDRYVKRSLMPIGEYMPFEAWFPVMREWAALDKEIVRGTDDRPLRLSTGTKVGVLVCYEDMVAANASSSTREGADCLVALVNGSAFTDSDTLKQHLQLAQLRTIENRRSLVRCAATGVSCLIQPDGTISQQLPLNTDQSMVVSVPLESKLTLYTRHGPWLSRGCTVFAIALIVVSCLKSPMVMRTLSRQPAAD